MLKCQHYSRFALDVISILDVAVTENPQMIWLLLSNTVLCFWFCRAKSSRFGTVWSLLRPTTFTRIKSYLNHLRKLFIAGCLWHDACQSSECLDLTRLSTWLEFLAYDLNLELLAMLDILCTLFLSCTLFIL